MAAFVRLLLRHIRGPLAVVWDNAPQHHARVVTRLPETYGRLRSEFLPPYSPDFNPDEGVWNHAKRVELGNFAPRGTDELVREARATLRRLKRRPGKIAEFWRQSELPLGGLPIGFNLAEDG